MAFKGTLGDIKGPIMSDEESEQLFPDMTLFEKIEKNDMAAIRQIIADGGFDLNSTADCSTKTPSGRPLLVAAIDAGNLEAAEALITAGVDVNNDDSCWRTPLIAAVSSLDGAKSETAVRMLLNAGAELERKCKARYSEPWKGKDGLKHRDGTALHHAARKGNVPVARMLLAAGADADARVGFNGEGASVMDVASGGVVKLLNKAHKGIRPTREEVGLDPAPEAASTQKPVLGKHSGRLLDEQLDKLTRDSAPGYMKSGR